MNTKPFVTLLVAVLVIGGSLGGAFAGGVALGKSQEEEGAPSTQSAQAPSSPVQQPSGQAGQQSLDQLRQQIQSGEVDPEDLSQLRQQFQGQFGQGAGCVGADGSVPGGRGLAGGAGLTGTIENIEDNTVTVNTSQGPLQATIGADTTIQIFTEGTLAELRTGLRVTVTGQRTEDGNVAARSILLAPEGANGFFDRGFSGGGFPGGEPMGGGSGGVVP